MKLAIERIAYPPNRFDQLVLVRIVAQFFSQCPNMYYNCIACFKVELALYMLKNIFRAKHLLGITGQ